MVPNTSETYFVDSLTFEQVGDVAWEVGKKSVKQWEKEFNRFSEEHAKEISIALDNYAVLYGVSKPDRAITIDIHHNPIEGNTNGGPKSNLDSVTTRFPIVNRMGDFMYRLPDHNGTNKEFLAEQAIKFLHESEHTFFQSEEFNDMVSKVMREPEVAQRFDSLSKEGGLSFREYANEPVELITTYLENIVHFESTVPSTFSESSPFVFRSDKDLQTALIEIEVTQNNGRPNGASAKFVNAWKRVLEEKLGIVDNAEEKTVSRSNDTSNNIKKPKYADVYQLGRALDPSLAYAYLDAKKPMDEKFVLELLELAERKVFEK